MYPEAPPPLWYNKSCPAIPQSSPWSCKGLSKTFKDLDKAIQDLVNALRDLVVEGFTESSKDIIKDGPNKALKGP